MDLDAAPYGGARYPVEARMDARIFARFHLDVGIGDAVMKPLETVEGRDWLKFAGIGAPPFRMIPSEQQFAEKLHAYTLPRSTPNSRVKDLVDLLLLIRSGKLAEGRIAEAVRVTFEQRKTHQLPSILAQPPMGWDKQFSELATECKVPEDMQEAFQKVQAFFSAVANAWQK
jgi:Nucleotidyl transferase AbiEii toxin, Type IV TA system